MEESERVKDEVDWAAAVQAASRPRMLPTFSGDGSGGPLVEGEKAGRPCPSPSRLRLGPAAVTVAYEVLLGTSGGSIDLVCTCSEDGPARLPIMLPFRGGNTGGKDVEVGRAPSSFGAGLLDFERSAAVPLARRSQDGLDLVEGLLGRSVDEGELSKED